MLEDLGDSQVLQYLLGLSDLVSFSLVSFEKKKDILNHSKFNRCKQSLASRGISWFFFVYRFRPLIIAKPINLFQAIFFSSFLVVSRRIQVVHARGYLPSLIGLVLKACFGTSLVFDMRGFWVDEKLEDGWKKSGILYRFLKRVEKLLLFYADQVIVLTASSVKYLPSLGLPYSKIQSVSIVPTLTQVKKFTFQNKADHRKILKVGYFGSAMKWYDFQKVAEFVAGLEVNRIKFHLSVYNKGQNYYISSVLKGCGLDESVFTITSLDPQDIPAAMAQVHVSPFFIRPLFSKQASAPTKFAELLASGVLCVTNKGYGDVSHLLESRNIGISVDSGLRDFGTLFDYNRMMKILDDVSLARRCRDVAEEMFDVSISRDAYMNIYSKLA